jgi:cytosine/adenosine deaminase-related metal-dependent hydrolase
MRLLIIARNRTVAVDGERICAPEGSFDIVLRCPEAEVRPGLINAHDHLHRNHYGRLGRPPYRNACDWAQDIQLRHREHIAKQREKVSRRGALLAGAWKNLFAGVTTLFHHDRWDADFDSGFPLRVVRIANADSLGMAPDLGSIATLANRAPSSSEEGVGGGASDADRFASDAGASPPPLHPSSEEEGDSVRSQPAARFGLHVAEGIDAEAAREVRLLDEMGLLDRDLLAVHCVGVDDDGILRLRRSGAALVWCPTSNLFLFGRTAPPPLFAPETDVLLGSDSLLTGEGDLLDELRAARALGRLGDARLEAAVGATAALRLGLPEPSLEPGARADLVLLTAPLLEARAQHVVLVIANGVPRIAGPEIARQFGDYADRGRRLSVGPVTRWASSIRSTANRIPQ